MGNQNDKSAHILNASSNLAGICFFVITSMKVLDIEHKTLLDEFTAINMSIFIASCIFSFLSIRSKTEWGERWYEQIADWLFLCGLLLIFVICMLITFNQIK